MLIIAFDLASPHSGTLLFCCNTMWLDRTAGSTILADPVKVKQMDAIRMIILSFVIIYIIKLLLRWRHFTAYLIKNKYPVAMSDQ